MADNALSGELSAPAPGRYLTIATAGLISGVLTIAMACAFSALIFSGPLSGYVSTGISLILFGAFILGVVTALTSSYAGTVARPHEIPAAIVAIIAASIAGHMTAGATGGAVFATVIAAIFITSCATGVFFLILGYLNLGNLIRFVPYPVIGGFLAGTGLLLVKGAFGVMTGRALTVENMAYLASSGLLAKWLPGLAFALVLFFILRWRNHYLVMPVWLTISFILFYIVAHSVGATFTDLKAGGWLIGSIEGSGARDLTMSTVAQIDWRLVAAQTGKILTILILSCISLLLNASGLEIVVKEDIDLNRELRATGYANLLSGFTGSTVGFHSLSLSALGYSMGAKSRMVGVISAVLCGSIILFGSSLLAYFPRPIMGGVLLFLGLTFLYEWLYRTWTRLPKTDYALIVFILVIIGMFGFLQGVAVGMLVAIVIFVVKYSHVSVVKHSLSGISFQSNVDRAPAQKAILSEKGSSIYILKLQGFIFFGTANDLYDRIRKRANDATRDALRFAVLDFRLVNGLDSSAVNTFIKMGEQARSAGYTIVFAQVPGDALALLGREGIDPGEAGPFRVFPDLDLAAEWCENEILRSERALSGNEKYPLEEHLRELFPKTRGRCASSLNTQSARRCLPVFT